MSRGAARLVLVALALGWLVFLGFLGRQEALRASGRVPDHVRHPYLEADSCRRCHLETWGQWHASPHGRALFSLQPRNLSRGEKVRTCLPCHAPEPVLRTGLGSPPVPRQERRREGVGCTTCHLGREGIASARPGVRGACRPVHEPALVSVELCQSCHNAHNTVDQWRASGWATAGVDCRSCHMPGRDHTMSGAHDPAMLRRAVDLQAHLEEGDLVVAIRNSGAGHNVPSGRRSRSLDLVVDFRPVGTEQRYRFRNPFQGEGGANTQLPSGQTRTLRWPLPSPSGTATVRLVFQFRPGQKDSAGVLVHERVVAW